MANNNGYTDPCEALGVDTGDDSGGSAVPPTPQQPEVEYSSVEPEYPWNYSIVSVGPNQHSRQIYILDSSNFYPSSQWRDFGIGLRTPAELDYSTPLQPPERIRRSIETVAARDHMAKEISLRSRSEQNGLDVPPRDNFRMMLDKVWTQTGGMEDLKYKTATELGGPNHGYDNRHHYTMPRLFYDANGNLRHDMAGTHTYDFRYSAPSNRGPNRNQPLRLYLWHEQRIFGEDHIVTHSLSHLGFRFFKDLLKRKILSSGRFWKVGTPESPLANDGKPIPSRITPILDSWVFGAASSSPHPLINDKQNWLFNPGEVYEDYCFIAPASYDISLDRGVRPIDARGIEGSVSITSKVAADSTSSQLDRARLRTLLSAGEVTADNISEQDIEVSEVELLDFYRSARPSQEIREVEFSLSPVVKFDTQNIDNMRRFNQYVDMPINEQPAGIKESLETHIDIKFANHKSQIARIIEKEKMDHFLLDIFHQSENFNETFTQIIDYDNLDPRSSGNVAGTGARLEFDKVRNFITLKKVRDFYFKFQQHADNMDNEEFKDSLENHYPLRLKSRSNPQYAESIEMIGYGEGGLRGHLRDKERTYKSILDGTLCHSEVVAYKIVKKISSTGEVVQTFYVSNTQGEEVERFSDFDGDGLGEFRSGTELGGIRLIDTQVIPGQTYEYSIFTINAVLGLEYSYQNISKTMLGRDPRFEPNGPQWGRLPTTDENLQDSGTWNHDRKDYFPNYYMSRVELFNHLSLIEAPYYQKEVTLDLFPPNRPEVTFLPEVGIEDKFTFLFQDSLQASSEQVPIPILPEDQEKIRQMYRSQSATAGDPIRYQTNSNPLVYEAMILGTPPNSYSDFSAAKVLRTDFTKPYLGFKVDINRNYYIIVRSLDRGGVSNPSEVYRVRMESHEDGINPVFESYKMISKVYSSEIDFQNLISIEPAQRQKLLINPDSQEINSPEFFNAAPDINNLTMDNFVDNEKSIWDRKFKFRLRSKTTGKSIDINVDFIQERIERQRDELSDQVSIESGARRASQLEYTDLTSDQEYQYGELDRELQLESNETPPPSEPPPAESQPDQPSGYEMENIPDRDLFAADSFEKDMDRFGVQNNMPDQESVGFVGSFDIGIDTDGDGPGYKSPLDGVITGPGSPSMKMGSTPNQEVSIKSEAFEMGISIETDSGVGSGGPPSSYLDAVASAKSTVKFMTSSSANLSKKDGANSTGFNTPGSGNMAKDLQASPSANKANPNVNQNSPRPPAAATANRGNSPPGPTNVMNVNTGGYGK